MKTKQKETMRMQKIISFLRRPIFFVPFGIFLIAIFFVFSWMSTYSKSDISKNEPFSGFVWYPALWISPFSFVSHDEVTRDVLAIRSHYESQDFSSAGLRVDFTTEEGRKRLKLREKELLNILLEQEVFRRIVNDAGLRVTDQEVNDSVDRKLEEFGTKENVEEKLKHLYGWTLDDFKEYIVKNELYREKAKSVFFKKDNSELNRESKEKIEEVRSKLDKGEDFVALAKEYSQGITAKEGGRFGWLLLGEIVEPAVAKAVLSLEIGSTSSIVESDLGYHIVKVHDSKKDTSGILYDISQIFIPKITFAQWMEQYLKAMNVRIFLKGYDWDTATGLIVFSEDEMKKFEANTLHSQMLTNENSNQNEDAKDQDERKEGATP